MITINAYNKEYPITVDVALYHNKTMAVRLLSNGSFFATLSVNLPESVRLKPGEFYVKNWSENLGFAEQLEAQGVIEKVDAPVVSSAFVGEIFAYRLVNQN